MNNTGCPSAGMEQALLGARSAGDAFLQRLAAVIAPNGDCCRPSMARTLRAPFGRRIPLPTTCAHMGVLVAGGSRSASPHVFAGVLLVLAALFAPAAMASQFERFGDLDVHYIVFNTTDLSPEMAERYGLTRSPDLGLVNISGRRLAEDGTTTAVRLELEGTVTNLLGQSQPLRFREVEDPAAIYYLETVRFSDRETLRFDIRATDTETGRRHNLRFQKSLWRQ